MFSALVAITFAALAVAAPWVLWFESFLPAVLMLRAANSANNQCNTGEIHCCNSVQSSSSPAGLAALASVGAAVGINVPVGLTCSPLSVVGLGSGSSWYVFPPSLIYVISWMELLPTFACDSTQQPVCCNGNNFNGLVVIGCTPINIGL